MRFLSSVLCFAAATFSFVSADASCSSCTSKQPVVTAPYQNVWQGLSSDEIASVKAFLQKSYPALNISEPSIGSHDNTFAQIDLLRPNKTDVLPFIAGKSGAPARYARATVVIGNATQPYYQEYMIGPLPVNNKTVAQPLTFLYNNKTPGKMNLPAVFVGGEDFAAFLTKFYSDVEDITKFMWNKSIVGGEVALHTIVPTNAGSDDSKTVAWAQFTNTATTGFDSSYLLPLGLSVQIDVTGHDETKWKVLGWYYNGIYYPSTDKFRAAIHASGFQILGMNEDGAWTSTDRAGDKLQFDELPPPIPVSEGSKRFSIDYKEGYITWMDFSFYLISDRNTGVRLYDVRFKGKKILYELGLEEAFTHYAGSDPVSSGTTYWDVSEGLGGTINPLINGHDCPSYSTYLNATWSDGGAYFLQPNGICLFEMDAGFPIQRHAALAQGYTSVTKNIEFTLRYVSTIGNYDFLTSFTFRLDGTMEVSVRASGYIQSTYYANNEDYGFKIHDYLSGSMHDHVLTWKADFDIMGEKNSLQKIDVVPTTEKYPWSGGRSRNTMKVVKGFVSNENQGKLNWAGNGASIYAVVNKDAKTKYGEYPGYRIKPVGGGIHLTVKDSTNAGEAANFAKEHLYVTKRKDTENQASHHVNQMNPADPLVNFDKFFNGESLDQEDIVVWFNLGMHHVPNTLDIPNTVYSTAHAAMSIEPFNYYESDQSRATAQQVRYNHTDNTALTFGQQTANCSVDLSQLTIGV